MQTRFSAAQLVDPDNAESERVLRKCVHCGFCTATCPTYVLLGDERDSPRGRIYLIKDMLENAKPASATVVRHIDRCLSCLSCMTTCPSDVHYMHLVDHARALIARTYRRPPPERFLRAALALVLPRPFLFRLALIAGMLARPFRGLFPAAWQPLLALVPWSLPLGSHLDTPQVVPAEGARRMRVALLTGCVQQVIEPAINEATVRLLTRLGCEVVIAPGSVCCGALCHHLGETDAARRQAAANIRAWQREIGRGGLDAIVSNASGCGTMVKDYGHLFRAAPALARPAAVVAALARDVSEVVAALGLPPARSPEGLIVAYHDACSLQHGQRVKAPPRALLAAAGFEVHEIAEGHLCCGSAGTYNLLQPDIAARLRARKRANIADTGAAVVATGNIGCITQLRAPGSLAIVHTVELLDWATGGPRPPALSA